LDTATLRGSTDQSGLDLQSSISIHSLANNLDIEVIVKDGVVYARKLGTPTWLSGALSPRSTTVTFPTLADGPIQYLGAERKGGKMLHHLRVPVLPSLNAKTQEVARACSAASFPMEFGVRADGTPVSAYLEFTCTLRGQQMGFTDSYAFTSFGSPIAIKPPAHFTPAKPSPAPGSSFS